MNPHEVVHHDASPAVIREFATKAYSDLGSSVPEFGAGTRTAIYDTAADALTDAGYSGFEHELSEFIRTLA